MLEASKLLTSFQASMVTGYFFQKKSLSLLGVGENQIISLSVLGVSEYQIMLY